MNKANEETPGSLFEKNFAQLKSALNGGLAVYRQYWFKDGEPIDPNKIFKKGKGDEQSN